MTDDIEVPAWAIVNKGFKASITSLGDLDTIAPVYGKTSNPDDLVVEGGVRLRRTVQPAALPSRPPAPDAPGGAPAGWERSDGKNISPCSCKRFSFAI